MKELLKATINQIKTNPKASAIAGGLAGAGLGGYVAHRRESRKGLDRTAEGIMLGAHLGRTNPESEIHAERQGGKGVRVFRVEKDGEPIVEKTAFWHGFQKAAGEV